MLPSSGSDRVECSRSRARTTGIVYALILPGLLGALAVLPVPHLGLESGAIVATLAAMAASDYAVSIELRDRGMVFDMGIPLALVALLVAGPWAGFAVALVPDALHLARRRRRFWCLGLVANVTSWAGASLAAAGVLAVMPRDLFVPAVALAGVAMVLANYLFARLLLLGIRDRRPIPGLLRAELLASLPVELAAIAVATLSASLLPLLGPLSLLGFAALSVLPWLSLLLLARIPSVAALSLDQAAAVYRAAIADELGLSRRDRRAVERSAAIVERRSRGGAGDLGLRCVVPDALLVSICMETTPRQPAFVASPRAQVILVARRWAELTARCTPALSHTEAMRELAFASTAADAPSALDAARRIVARERGLSAHVAGVPRLHRALVPRRVRRTVLPRVLATVAG